MPPRLHPTPLYQHPVLIICSFNCTLMATKKTHPKIMANLLLAALKPPHKAGHKRETVPSCSILCSSINPRLRADVLAITPRAWNNPWEPQAALVVGDAAGGRTASTLQPPSKPPLLASASEMIFPSQRQKQGPMQNSEGICKPNRVLQYAIHTKANDIQQ